MCIFSCNNVFSVLSQDLNRPDNSKQLRPQILRQLQSPGCWRRCKHNSNITSLFLTRKIWLPNSESDLGHFHVWCKYRDIYSHVFILDGRVAFHMTFRHGDAMGGRPYPKNPYNRRHPSRPLEILQKNTPWCCQMTQLLQKYRPFYTLKYPFSVWTEHSDIKTIFRNVCQISQLAVQTTAERT